MRFKRLKVSTVFLLGLGITGLWAQDITTASGGEASGSGGTVSYSVGQMVYTTNSGSTGTVAQGVQQSFVITVVSGIEEVAGIDLKVIAFPNPVKDYLILKADNCELSDFSFQVYDCNGKLLESNKMIESETRISMNNLVPAVYFLKVNKDNKEIKTFKIIKN